MPATTITLLGEPVLARRWRLDVNTGSYASPTWVALHGIEEFKWAEEPTLGDDSDYDDGGYKSATAAALALTIDIKVGRKPTAAVATAYDGAQEALRAASRLLGSGNKVDVRWYEMTSGGPKVEAYRAYVTVTWGDDGGAMDALASVTIKLTGKGAATAITHPDGAAVVPVLYSVTPAVGVQAGGTLHRLTGVGFFAAGVADVQSMKLGVTNVPTFMVESDNALVFLAPAKAQGPFIVYVTNTVGESVTATVTITVS